MEIVKYCTRFINSGMSRCHWVNISPAFPQGSLGRQDCLTLKMILRNPGNFLRWEHRTTSRKTAVPLCEQQSGKTCKSHPGYTYVITVSSVMTSKYAIRPVFAEVYYYGVTVIWKIVIISCIISHALREWNRLHAARMESSRLWWWQSPVLPQRNRASFHWLTHTLEAYGQAQALPSFKHVD
jgi:hypothetical protein